MVFIIPVFPQPAGPLSIVRDTIIAAACGMGPDTRGFLFPNFGIWCHNFSIGR
jgi:hypothetical protein